MTRIMCDILHGRQHHQKKHSQDRPSKGRAEPPDAPIEFCRAIAGTAAAKERLAARRVQK